MEQNRKTIYFSGFLFSVPMALMLYVNSSFLSSFISKDVVGLIFATGSILSILALCLAPGIFRKIGGYKFLLWVVGINALTILTCALSRNPWIISIAFVWGFTMNTLIVFSLDELLKIFSKTSAIGRIRGVYLAVCHLAFILSQLVSGTILGYFSFGGVYLIAFGVMVLFFIFSLLNQ